MDISVEIHCDVCGSANFSVPAAEDNTAIRCNDCGADQGSIAELKAELYALANAQSVEALRRGLDRPAPGAPLSKDVQE